jgi:class 3 adenylate cyclase/dienelactone hydrolase
MTQSRQLAAIMFADIVGYTAMMQDDEELTLNLRNKLKNKLEKELAIHGGKLIKFSGDGALCSFDSATESVRVAIAVQLLMLQEPKVPLRIGIHQADVVFEGSDVLGDGVNIASRLESLAIPGSVFISSKVYDDIKNQNDIQTISLGKYLLKNVTEPIEIYSVSNPGLEVPLKDTLDGKGIKYISDKVSFRKKPLIIKFLSFAAIISLLAYLFIPNIINKQNAKNKLLPAIQKLVDDSFRPPTEAFDLGLEAEKYIPTDSTLINLWPTLSTSVSIITEPQGAEVFWKDYHTPDASWRLAGSTPLKEARFPRGYLRMEFRKNGHQTIEYAGPWAGRLGPNIDTLKMDLVGDLPENMVRIPKFRARMYIVGLEQETGKQVAEFLIDKYEVTNKQYKEFIDANGYSNPSFWKYPFYSDGQEITLTDALAKFVDKTGRQGPSNWEVGTYPNGLENHPVTGISWYEAAAYASFVKKQLPTIFHWSVVAHTSRTQFIVPLSNYNRTSTVPVGSMKGYSSFGVYDLAGNAREWCFNESDQKGQRYTLGGGYNDPTYSFNDSYTQPAMDRSTANGFRCIKELKDNTDMLSLKKVIPSLFRDYRKEKPVDDKTFSVYLNQFKYDKAPLDSKVEEEMESDSWKVEKISFDAGYNNERMQAWLYIPKDVKPPYQTVVFFPGSGAIHTKKFDPDRITGFTDFILKSGRALVHPIYKGTFERDSKLNSDLQEETVLYKDHVVMWGKEMGRTIDYLETRSDIQADKIGYLGWSWGGFMGGIMPAVEKRIQAVVLNVGGMEMNKTLPEADQLNYLPRVTQPVLMLNGKHDMFFPVETSQNPMYDFLGTPLKDKKKIIYEAGHLVPRTDFVRETLSWFDQYLGTIE